MKRTVPSLLLGALALVPAAAAQQTDLACVLHLGRLCWMCLSSMERTRAGAVPAGCRGRIAAGDGRAVAR